jgi:superfamily I DNA and/or RNA helicase
VLVEEAAEVFEAHIVTALTRDTEHLILIGDHEQLRPNPAVYDLSHNYNLSMSMFERLINNKVPHATLDTQRRMRPEISKMMNLIYPNLKNHESVTNYPSVKGLQKNLFFLNHKFLESSNELMQSKLNTEEAKLVVRFVQYLL